MHGRAKTFFMNICRGGKVTGGENCLKLGARLEKRTINRLGRIDETGKFKVIRDDKKTRDKSYARIINVYKAGKINHKEYMRRIVKLRRMHDLPKQRAVLFRALEKSDSESD